MWPTQIWGKWVTTNARPGAPPDLALHLLRRPQNSAKTILGANAPQPIHGRPGEWAVPAAHRKFGFPLYDFPSWQSESHRLNHHSDTNLPPLPGDHTPAAAGQMCSAIESFLTPPPPLDEPVRPEARPEDPGLFFPFRLRQLSDKRAPDVIRRPLQTRPQLEAARPNGNRLTA